MRLRAGLSMRDLSIAIGVSHVAISNWEAGEQPRLDHLQALARELGTTVGELCGEGRRA